MIAREVPRCVPPLCVLLTSFGSYPPTCSQGFQPRQLVFVDETSKDDRTARRLYAYGMQGSESCGVCCIDHPKLMCRQSQSTWFCQRVEEFGILC